jgi:hypothetical protein
LLQHQATHQSFHFFRLFILRWIIKFHFLYFFFLVLTVLVLLFLSSPRVFSVSPIFLHFLMMTHHYQDYHACYDDHYTFSLKLSHFHLRSFPSRDRKDTLQESIGVM